LAHYLNTGLQGTDLTKARHTPELADKIRQAFREIHELGVLHDDVRDQNVLVKPDGSVVLIDFELSRFGNVMKEEFTNEMNNVEQMIGELEDRCSCCGKEAGTGGDGPKGYSPEESDVENIMSA
jgi:serine/threonine protein kinase